MLRALILVTCAAVLAFGSLAIVTSSGTSSAAEFCTFKRESSSGLNKICYYDCAGSEAAITIGSHEVCPPSITR